MARTRNYLAGIGASTIFGFSFLFTKNALDDIAPHELIFLRFLTAAIIMSVLVLLGFIKLDYRGKDLRTLFLTAMLQPFLYFILETEGIRRVESSTAGIILSAVPVMVTVLAALTLKERLKPLQIGTTLLSFTGVLTIVIFRSYGAIGGQPLGVVLLILSMLCAASFNIMSRRSSRFFKPAETTFFMMWFAVISFGGIFAVRTIMGGGTDLLSRLSPRSISSILYLGILSSVVAFFLINYNLSKLKSPEAAVFANLTTLVSVFAGLAFRNESIRPTDFIGGIMIIAGVWGTNVLGGRTTMKKAST